MLHGMSIDVEDYYQIVHKNYLHRQIEPSAEVERNTLFLLDTLGQAGVKATFFVLATIAHHYPGLVKRMVAEGHEVGVHGYEHALISTMTPETFRENIRRAQGEIEDLTGYAVTGHRAPAFSITKDSFWAIDVLRELHFVYDSSVYPIKGKRYGIPDAPKHLYRWQNGLYEVPLSCIEVCGQSLPVAGGGYLRYFPFFWTRYALRRIEQAGRPAVIYMHPYEFEQTPPSAFPYRDDLPFRLKLHNALQSINRGNRHREKLRQLLAACKFTTLLELVRHHAHENGESCS